ncbi:MAG: PQQ-binding-like beta-propeller repeat protein [Deltaproteobacteria bacterium]|jgi:hypothetical protein|nr:PQQ-binding-like beta-propeller repeat protein [Deltaproteobacteria bacterium]
MKSINYYILLFFLSLPFSDSIAVNSFKTNRVYQFSFFKNIPTYRANFKRDGKIGYFGPSSFVTKWKFKAGGNISSSPVLDKNDNVIFGSKDDHLYSVNFKGQLNWKFKTSGDVDCTPTITKNGNIHFGSDDNYLYCLSSSGRQKWKVRLSGYARTSPLVLDDGLVITTSYYGYLYAIKNGKIIWKKYFGGYSKSSPSWDKKSKRIYVATRRGKVSAWTKKGKMIWSKQVTNRSYRYLRNSTVPIGEEGNLYVSTNEGVISIDPKGKIRWRIPQIKAYIPPTRFNKNHWVVVSQYGYFFKFNNSGTIISKKKMAGSYNYSSVLVDGKGNSYFGSRDNHFYGVDPDGKLLFKKNTGNNVDASATIGSDGTLYFGSNSDYLYALKKSGN